MQTKFLLLSGLAVVLSFTGGFLVANSLNKADIEALNKKNAELQANLADKPTPSGDAKLTESQIETELKTAAEKPKDFNFQKRLAFELYSYSLDNKGTDRLEDVEVLLKRAYAVNPDDYEVIVARANLSYQLATDKKNADYFGESRSFFEKAIKKRPKDLRVLTDFAVTLLESPSPDPARAVDLLESAYEIDKKSEIVVNGLVRAYLAAGNVRRASEMVAELKTINPQNPLVQDIDNKLKTEASQ